MKQATSLSKMTQKTKSISRLGSDSATSRNGISIAPPNYGIDFVDSNSAVVMPVQKSSGSWIQVELAVSPALEASINQARDGGQYLVDNREEQKSTAHALTHVAQQGNLREQMLHRRSETSKLTEGSTEPLAIEGATSERSEPANVKASLPEKMEITEEEESDEEEKLRWTDYTIVKKDAYVRNEPSRKKSSIRSILKINGNYAYLRKPDNFEPIHITDPATAVIPKGTKLVKTKKAGFRLAIQKDTEVMQRGDPKKHGRSKYYQVQWGNEIGWIRAGNTNSVRVSIPVGTQVTVIESKKVDKGKFARVQWNGQEGWTAYSNISEKTWDLTYATRFRAKEKSGLVIKVPKTTRLRFEDDGQLIGGKVHKKNANKRDATDFKKVLPDILQKDTPCLILESRNPYYRVLDYAGLWDASAEPPGWWTRSTNIKTVPGKINIDEITSDVVRNYVKENQPERTAAETAISVSDISKTGKLIGHMVNGNASIRDEMGRPTKDNLPLGAYLMLGQEIKSVPQKKGPAKIKKLFKVVRLDDTTGTEYWTWFKNIQFKKFEHGYSVRQKEGRLVLITRTKPAEARGQEPKADEYTIAPTVAEKLEGAYFTQVAQLIATKKYTRAQEDLLYYARIFARNLVHDEAKHPKPANLIPLKDVKPLVIPESAKRQKGDDLTLNKDLIERIQRFYTFLRHTNLITGTPPPRAIGGIRARTVAHELSTKWTLSPRSGHLRTHEQRLEFTRRLVSLGGMPDVSNIDWLLPGEIALLDECLHVIDAPGTFYQSWLFPLITNFSMEEIFSLALSLGSTNVLDTLGIDTTSGKPGQKQTPGEENRQMSLLIGDVRTLVDELVKVSQSYVKYVGNRRIQKAQAAEGFPRSEKWDRRRPNTNDRTGVSNHCGGEAIDITFPFVFNYYDPIIDTIALYFGLYRPVKDSRRSPEHWHYERVGTSLGERSEVESMLPGQQGNPDTHWG